MAKQGESSGGRAVASASVAGRRRPRSPYQAGRRWVVGLTGRRRLLFLASATGRRRQQGDRKKRKFSIGCRTQDGASTVCRAEGKASAVSFVSREGQRRRRCRRSLQRRRRRRRRQRAKHTHSLQRAKLQSRSVVGRTDHTLEAAGRLVGNVSTQIGCKCGTSRRIGADRWEDVSSYRPAS